MYLNQFTPNPTSFHSVFFGLLTLAGLASCTTDGLLEPVVPMATTTNQTSNDTSLIAEEQETVLTRQAPTNTTLIVTDYETCCDPIHKPILGLVEDDYGNPLEGVQVNLDNEDPAGVSYSTTTDANGNYRIDDLDLGNYQVYFRKTGYVEQQHAVSNTEDPTELDVTLIES